MLKLYVLYNNKRPIRIECKGQTLEESEDKVAAYINDSKSRISEERGKDYSVGVQYDGIIENNTVNDTITVVPFEYNKQIIKGGEQTFGFVNWKSREKRIDRLYRRRWLRLHIW